MARRAFHLMRVIATSLIQLGRNDEALVEIERARELDPNSSSILADRARILWITGSREEALQLLKQLEAAEPNFTSPHRYLKAAYLEMRDYPNYLAEMRKEALLTGDASMLAEAEAAAKGFGRGGEREMLSNELSVQARLYGQGKLSPYVLAGTEARLGNTRETLKYLALSVESHDESALGFSGEPGFCQTPG